MWMASRGAKHLAFVSRSGTDSQVAKDTVTLLQARHGVKALVLRADITKRDELDRAEAEIDQAQLPAVRGVLNAAAVFKDTLFSNMTLEAWNEVVDTKVKGSMNLHELFKEKDLDFFVMTSSVASTLGSSGQANYSAGKHSTLTYYHYFTSPSFLARD